MPVLIGLLFGRWFAHIAFSRVVLAAVLWAAVYGSGEDLGRRFVHPRAGWIGGLLACALLLGWTLWRPARSRARLWVLDGVYVWLRLAMIAAVVLTLLAVLEGRGDLGRSLKDAWPLPLAGSAAWAAQRCLARLLVRSHRREGDLSVL